MTEYRVQDVNGKPTVLDDKGHEVPGALVLKISSGLCLLPISLLLHGPD